MIDLKKALLDPTLVYAEPSDVVADLDLTRDQQIEILRRWEYDARELEVAEEEAGMTLRRPEMFDLVVQACTPWVRNAIRSTRRQPNRRQDWVCKLPFATTR